jgi:hypothetical protein
VGKSVQEYTTEFRKMAIMLGISPKNPYVLLKYLGGLHSHLQKQVMLFRPRTMDEVCVQAQYMENKGQKKGQPSGLKKKEDHEVSKEGKEEVEMGKR